MTARKPLHLVPQLRFPEFQEAPAWFIEPLGCLFPERNETGFSELPLLSVTDREGVVPQEETNRKITANANRAKYLRVVPGDIVYNTMRMWEGRSARVSMEGVVSPAYTVCRPSDEVNSYFFAYYFKTWSLIAQFRKYSQGLVKDTLSLKYGAFSLIPVGFPPPNEQQKIADCLGLLDDLIAAEGRKLDALRQHKQGLMQQLFPQPGETVPKLRFPEFEDAPGWRQATIGEFSPFSYGKSLRKDIRNLAGHIPVFGSNGHVGWHDKALTDGPTIIIGRKGTVGAVHYSPVPCWPIDTTFFVSGSDAELVSFKYYALNALGLAAMNTDSAVPGLNRKACQARELRIPPQFEQRVIADCLGSLDDLITKEGRKLDALRQHKQGLMQQLFPSLDGQ